MSADGYDDGLPGNARGWRVSDQSADTVTEADG